MPESELKRIKERKQTKAKVTPLNLPTRRPFNDVTERDEENKMLHDSAANNSALALTIDVGEQREFQSRLKVSRILWYVIIISSKKRQKSIVDLRKSQKRRRFLIHTEIMMLKLKI